MTGPHPRPGFLQLTMTDILGWIILCRGGCRVPYGILSSFPGLHSEDGSGVRLVTTKNGSWGDLKTSLDQFKNLGGGRN